MNILHYSLGLPPYRTGGLTKYSVDLMIEQAKQGDEVFLLFPGRIRNYEDEPQIKKYKMYNSIDVYEMINPLPVPLLNGVLEIKDYTKTCNINVFIDFLKLKEIQILHVHTLMGLYSELIDACKYLDIKIIFTTHDYYGLCTKVNYLNEDGNVCNNTDSIDVEKCIKCNKNAYSKKTITVLQSKTYRELKNKGLIKFLKKSIGKVKRKSTDNTELQTIENENRYTENKIEENKINEYKNLLKYYEKIFYNVDYFLYNSSISEKIYSNKIKGNGEVVAITHKDIKDNRVRRNYDNKELKLTYLGPTKVYKGFKLICDVMDEIHKNEKVDITLNVYGGNYNGNIPANMKVNGEYVYDEIGTILKDTDVLVVPSIWYETFGFITIEALSYGVPVIISDRVGSKDLIDSSNGIVVSPTKESFIEAIMEVYRNKQIIESMNRNILEDSFELNIETHVNKIKKIYSNVLKGRDSS